ncbi:YARHG domain-containing protein [Aquimarina sp. 2304DJ70-9]|uniref:YARHG domain-containing protein n=1 Tax=Aquimarina penaris TaxID=3231044 RepID=UPI0034621C03
MNKNLLFVFILCTTYSQAQLKDCSQCNTVVYTTSDIAKNTLYELQLLRNEVFARHRYVFKSVRLEDYFLTKEWYNPNHDDVVQVQLNAIEKKNVTLFRDKETEIENQRKQLFKELTTLKEALQTNNAPQIKKYLSNVLPEDEGYDNAIQGLTRMFAIIDLDDIHWYKDTALYQVKIDNGFLVKVIALRINGNEITLSAGDISHSEIMTEPFKYGSDYHSEDEYYVAWIFNFDGQRLVLKDRQIAG